MVLKPSDLVMNVRYVVTKGNSTFQKGDVISWDGLYVLNYTAKGMMPEDEAKRPFRKLEVAVDMDDVNRQIAKLEDQIKLLRSTFGAVSKAEVQEI